jgi:hypothetical protein
MAGQEKVELVMDALKHGWNEFQRGQENLRRLRAVGASDSAIREALVKMGCGGISCERALSAHSMSDMIDCMMLTLRT